MSYVRYRKPTVLIQVNGKPSPEITEARISFQYTDRIGKRNTAMIVLADPLRKFRDGGLQPDDHYLVAWGYPGNFTRPRDLVLKGWTCNDDARIGRVTLELQDTGRSPKTSKKDQSPTSELHKTHQPQTWGMLQTSDIAKKIASRHGLTAVVENSDDVDDVAHIQPYNTSDYAYLRRLAENIDYEFFVENGHLYYRAKPYSEPPRQEFYYFPHKGEDTLLISFTPKAKVSVVATRPTGKSVQVAEPPWILQARDDVAQQAAELFNADTDAAAQALVTVVEEAGDDAADAADLRAKLSADPTNVSTNQDYQEQLALMTVRIQQFQQANKEFQEGRKGSGKVNIRQKSKPIGADGQHDKTCPKKQQKPGSNPTGDAVGNVEVNLRDPSESPIGISVGMSQSVVTTTAGTEKQRKKLACASHSKRKDRAVTASAVFIGDPFLRAKVNYLFRNVGTLYEGSWYAKQATHTVEETFRVSMELKRGALKKIKKNKGQKTSDDEEKGITEYVVGLREDTRRGLETLGGMSVPLDISPTGIAFSTSDGRIVSTPTGAAVPDF